MKVTPRFMIRAALVLTAGGVIGFVGACKSDSPVAPPPPPPPGAPAAPSGLIATPVGASQVNLAWTDNANNESGFRVDRCSGAGCTNFAQVGTDLAPNTVTYSDLGLTASTVYSYRVRAFGANAADVSAWSATVPATTGSVTTSFTMVGAGEITNCATTASIATAGIIRPMLSDTNVIVFTAGNNLADPLPGSTYADCFAPKWGDFKDRTYFAIGNADYMGGRGIDGVHSYLGDRTTAKGSLGRSFDRGNWHIIILNSGDWEQSSIQLQDPNGPMNAWLAADLAATTQPCIIAISWERRIYTTDTGTLGWQFNMKQAANLLYAAGADILVSSKDKIYARFPQTNADGVPDPKGFRQFIVGTGGRSLDETRTPAGSPVEVQEGSNSGNSNGVIKFTLHESSYEWEFIPTLAGGFTDKSSAPVPCH
jgi:hypothetical protein